MSPFKPKINNVSKNVESVTKSIWSSRYTSTASMNHHQSIEKFKESTYRSENSMNTTEGISLHNAEEIKFLFN